jgi:hypothetical protein
MSSEPQSEVTAVPVQAEKSPDSKPSEKMKEALTGKNRIQEEKSRTANKIENDS